jgi:hypothetical protein
LALFVMSPSSREGRKKKGKGAEEKALNRHVKKK